MRRRQCPSPRAWKVASIQTYSVSRMPSSFPPTTVDALTVLDVTWFLYSLCKLMRLKRRHQCLCERTKYSRPIAMTQHDHVLTRSANGCFNRHFTVARDPGLPDAAGLLGLWGAALAGARRTRLPKLGCHAKREMLPPMPRPVPAPPGIKRRHGGRDKRREDQQKPQAPGGTTHMNHQRTQQTGGTFFAERSKMIT